MRAREGLVEDVAPPAVRAATYELGARRSGDDGVAVADLPACRDHGEVTDVHRRAVLGAHLPGPPVLDALRPGPRGFLALARSVDGISHRMLARTLRELVAAGLVHRPEPSGALGTVAYSLTDEGRRALELLDEWVTIGPCASPIQRGT